MKTPFKDPSGVAECNFAELHHAVAKLWPDLYTMTREDDFAPIVDGHWRVGFSLRLFGPPPTISGTRESDPTFDARRRGAWLAMEQLQCALEDLGYETTRDGNAWQSGRLILGWAITADGARIADLPAGHADSVARRNRLREERAKRADASRLWEHP